MCSLACSQVGREKYIRENRREEYNFMNKKLSKALLTSASTLALLAAYPQVADQVENVGFDFSVTTVQAADATVASFVNESREIPNVSAIERMETEELTATVRQIKSARATYESLSSSDKNHPSAKKWVGFLETKENSLVKEAILLAIDLPRVDRVNDATGTVLEAAEKDIDAVRELFNVLPEEAQAHPSVIKWAGFLTEKEDAVQVRKFVEFSMELPSTAEISELDAEELAKAKTDIATAKEMFEALRPSAKQHPSANKWAGFLDEKADAIEEAEELSVKSVSAINGKELVIKFSKPVDKSTVISSGTTLTGNNITVTAVDGDAQAIGTLSGSLSADRKTLTISNSTFFKGNYTVAVSDSVTASGEKVSKFAEVVTVNDTTAPKYVSASATAKESTNQLDLVFDEPVQNTGVIAYVDGVAAQVLPGSDLYTLTVQTSSNVKAGETVEVSLLNVKDFAGNLTTPNPLKTNVTVVADTVAPSVSSVAVVGESTVNVTFSKPVTNDAALKGAVSLLDTNGVSQGSFTFVEVKNDGKTVVYTAPGFTFGPNDTYTGNLLIQNTVLDTLGNKMVNKYNTSVTFTKDVVAPVAQSVQYKDGKLSVTFSENVAEVSVGSKTGIKIINKQTGAEVTVFGTVSIVDNNKFVLDQAIAPGSYEVRLPGQLVKDISGAKNKNAAVILDFTVAAASSNDKVAPTFTYGVTNGLDIRFTSYTGTAPAAEQVLSYTVQDSSGIDLGTVRNLNNYTLNGKALPAGTYITTNYNPDNVAAALTVNVNVPSSKIATTDTNSLLVVSGIRDAAGNTADPQISEVITVFDGVAPELTKASISSGDKSVLVVEVSEAVTGLDAAADLVLKVNGSTEAVDTVELVTSGTDKGKYYVTGSVTTDFTAASTITLELAEDSAGTSVTDTQGNAAVFGEVITIK